MRSLQREKGQPQRLKPALFARSKARLKSFPPKREKKLITDNLDPRTDWEHTTRSDEQLLVVPFPRVSGVPTAREFFRRTTRHWKWRATVNGPSGTGGVVRVMFGHYPRPHALAAKRASRLGRLIVGRRFNAGSIRFLGPVP